MFPGPVPVGHFSSRSSRTIAGWLCSISLIVLGKEGREGESKSNASARLDETSFLEVRIGTSRSSSEPSVVSSLEFECVTRSLER